MNGRALLEGVAGHRWLQSLRFTEDLATPGLTPETQSHAEEMALLDPLNLTGAHVLEVGAANGAFSFAALRRGAGRVLATDHLAWMLPGSDAMQATQWAARALAAPLDVAMMDPRELAPRNGTFDVVLATAFFERAFNPIQALRGLRNVTGRVLLIETLHDGLGDARPMMLVHNRHWPIGGPEGTWVAGWAPNPPLVLQLLHDLGFDRILYRDHPVLGSARGMYAALLPDTPQGVLAGFGPPWISMTQPRPG